jgi:intraflagellar transport protein 122
MQVREWVLEAPVTYLKIMGGPPGSELLLTGLANGSVLQVAA